MGLARETRSVNGEMTEPRNFSWFVEGKLAGMAYPRETDLAFLAGQGIKTLVNLTPDDYYSGVAEQHGVQMKTIRVPAFEPPTLEQIREFLELVDSTKEVNLASYPAVLASFRLLKAKNTWNDWLRESSMAVFLSLNLLHACLSALVSLNVSMLHDSLA